MSPVITKFFIERIFLCARVSRPSPVYAILFTWTSEGRDSRMINSARRFSQRRANYTFLKEGSNRQPRWVQPTLGKCGSSSWRVFMKKKERKKWTMFLSGCGKKECVKCVNVYRLDSPFWKSVVYFALRICVTIALDALVYNLYFAVIKEPTSVFLRFFQL